MTMSGAPDQGAIGHVVATRKIRSLVIGQGARGTSD